MKSEPVKSELTANQIQQALEEAGLEVYTASHDEIRVAERIRLHIMDSGIRLVLDDGILVRFTARCQRSDFPKETPEALFSRVRHVVGRTALGRGYAEMGAALVEVKDPVDDSHVLDTWHEVTFERSIASIEEAVSEVRWALGVEKYVSGDEAHVTGAATEGAAN